MSTKSATAMAAAIAEADPLVDFSVACGVGFHHAALQHRMNYRDVTGQCKPFLLHCNKMKHKL